MTSKELLDQLALELSRLSHPEYYKDKGMTKAQQLIGQIRWQLERENGK